ncbi:calpain 7, variant 2 [Clonorchis sinensis]|nr:calpain 7, variant 2 [Clonorchis sinensis]
MVDPAALEADAKNFADVAATYETSKQYEAAVFFYTEAAQALINAQTAGSTTPNIRDIAHRYIKRAEDLKAMSSTRDTDVGVEGRRPSVLQNSLSRAKFIFHDAITEDEKGNFDEAVELYGSAVELLLSLRAQSPNESTMKEIKKLANEALSRAEVLKDRGKSKPTTAQVTSGASTSRQTGGYSAEELKVLKATSTINGREYPPFLDFIDLRMRFAFPKPYTIIYPQSRDGEAVYNPCGMYVVRFHINGVPRKVVIDDYLPMARNGELLCSFSTNRSELWVSLLEKAYMKVMGGYDFPGSNSGIDLHALTGWIPERITIRSNNMSFNKDREFRRLLSRFHRGHCLCTVATGEMTEDVATRAGLVPSHAYAMLDIREVDDKRLLLLKNPWSHLRWKGNFSEQDSRNWTPQLQAKLNYDLSSAQAVDNGVFWIDYDSVCHYFDVFYVNWNPELFQHTTCVHDMWLAHDGPKKDSYSCANNPQYNLEVQATVAAPVWALLTRHITDKEDFADNKEFIALVVYKNIKTRKVYCPYEVEPFRDSVRANSPHCLVQFLQDPGTANYTFVVSQFEKNNTIRYTLRVYSTAPFVLSKITDPYKVEKQVTGQWKGANAGGCPNHPDTYDRNPCYQINLSNNELDNQLLVEMRGPKDYAIGCELIKVSATNPDAPNKMERKSSGTYR